MKFLSFGNLTTNADKTTHLTSPSGLPNREGAHSCKSIVFGRKYCMYHIPEIKIAERTTM